MSDDETIHILLEALALERDAQRRYADHKAATGDPRLYAFWEGLRRNESDHHRALLDALEKRGVAVEHHEDDA
jgi:rubrerythrin